MQYHRSQPWRPRGPGFANRTGSRRRGRLQDLEHDALTRSDAGEEIVLASPNEASAALAGSMTQPPRLMLLALGHHGQGRQRSSVFPSSSILGSPPSPLGKADACRTA